MAGSPLTFAALQTLPNTPPVPLEANLYDPSGNFEIRFSQRLRPRIIDPNNWTIRVPPFFWNPDTLAVDGFWLRGTSTIPGTLFPPATVDYLAIPPDVVNLRMTQAAAFVDFLLTII